MKNILINFILLFSIIVPIVNCNTEPMVKKEFTENKDKEWHEGKLNEDLSKIEYDHDSIHFVSTGRFGIYIENEKFTGHADWVNDFYLKYTSSFDHRSFGKNLITTDTGIINLKYK